VTNDVPRPPQDALRIAGTSTDVTRIQLEYFIHHGKGEEYMVEFDQHGVIDFPSLRKIIRTHKYAK